MFKFSFSSVLLFAWLGQSGSGYLAEAGLYQHILPVSSYSCFSEDSRQGIPLSFTDPARECGEKKESKSTYIPEGCMGRPFLPAFCNEQLFKFSHFSHLPGEINLFLLNKIFLI